MSPDDIERFREWGAPLPSRDPHVTDTAEEPLSNKLKSVNPRNWRQQGNQLICDTDWGEMRQSIPTSHILAGVNKKGLPEFKKISI